MFTHIELEQAVRLMTEGQSPLGAELCPLNQALGRTLSMDVTASIDQPPFDRSPLDGYALRSADSVGADSEHPLALNVVDTVYAGDVAKVPVEPGQAVRIMTGAMLPEGCDCVLRQEDTDMGFPAVSIRRSLRPNENIVHRGTDYRMGATLLPSGTVLDAAALGLLASAGIGEVSVRRRPHVCVLSTGDEVSDPRVHPLAPGKIYDANLTLLTARLAELGILTVESQRAADQSAAAAEAMGKLLERCDLLITTGGVSVGDRDILHETLTLLGAERIFWRVKMKPGTPAIFARYGGKPILCLSGNPFAAAATFEVLARPLLAALAGEPHLLPQRTKAVLDTPFPKASLGRRFVRGRFEAGRVTLPGEHSSGALSSLVGCNCLADIPAGSGPLEQGKTVDILLL